MRELTDPSVIAAYLRRNIALHLYEIGDLDPFFRPQTRWFGNDEAIVLLYAHPAMPTLIAMAEPERFDALRALCADLAPELPDELYLHRSEAVPDTLLPGFALSSPSAHQRMMLTAPALDVPADAVTPLTVDMTPRLEAFYACHYPENWFDRRMVETGCYFGLEIDGELASVAGVHVMSREQRVAALGNIATATAHRGKGLARRVTAACCRHLSRLCDHIGLNVERDNAAAIACYARLGFTHAADYREAVARRTM